MTFRPAKSSRFFRMPRLLGIASGALVILASTPAFAAWSGYGTPVAVYVPPPPPATVYVTPPPKAVVAPPPKVVVAAAPLPAVVVRAASPPRAVYVAPRAVYVARPPRAAVRVPGHWAGAVWVPAHLA
ncbi:hypothetical protein [Cupriavidus necator]